MVDEHRQYLADGPRIAAFKQAIDAQMRPGDVVVDLGSGTGILGMMACRAGAARVYSIEAGGIIGLARKISNANEFGDRHLFLHGLSTRIELPEKVDVVLGDHTGRFGFETGILQDYPDARKRFLKPGGKLIPSAIAFWIAPVEHARQWQAVEFWRGRPAGFEFAPARELAANTVYPLRLEAENLLSAPQSLLTLDLYTAGLNPFDMSGAFRIERAGTFHGVGGWCVAELGAGVELTASPLSPDRIDRRNVFFPAEQAIQVQPGDEVRIHVNVMPLEFVVTWKVELRSASGERKARFTHSTFRGMLMPKEDVVRTSPDFVPKINKWGKARSSILSLCDGVHSLREVEDEIFRRHSDLFGSREEAATFVAEVVTRYSS